MAGMMYVSHKTLSHKTILTHFSPVSHFYTPWKHQKTFGSLVHLLLNLDRYLLASSGNSVATNSTEVHLLKCIHFMFYIMFHLIFYLKSIWPQKWGTSTKILNYKRNIHAKQST